MKPVIGLDYGTSTIQLQYMDADGIFIDLTRPDVGGIPTTFFFADIDGTEKKKCGYDAVTTAAFPIKNRIPCGKFHLKESVEIDGHTLSQADILRSMIEYAVNYANQSLRQKNLPPCCEISVTYPALFKQDEINRFIGICESAVAHGGKPVKVVASLPEPAAAALAFLESEKCKEPTTVLTLDIGAGTTDIALLSTYPAGKTRPDGTRYQFELHAASEGIPVAGNRFDEALFDVITSSLPEPPGNLQKQMIKAACEGYKKELSTETVCRPTVFDKDSNLMELEIARDQFERASADLLSEIVTLVRSALSLEEAKAHRPDIFLLTGGSAQMPMIADAISRNFPEFSDKLRVFNPLKSVAVGAAVYARKRHQICRRTSRSIALFCRDDDGDRYVEIIPIGAELPFQSDPVRLTVTQEGHDTFFSVCEGHDGHYQEVIRVMMETSQYPTGAEIEAFFTINGQGVLLFQANREDKKITAEHKLKLV